MKKRSRVIVISSIFGMISWVVDAIFDHFIFYEKPFWDLLIFHVPFHEIYIRGTILACFLVFGAIASRLVAAQERAELSGGSFAIHSALGAGTLVTASWPIP